ncbi:DNA-binding protein [Bradyrhizobium centrolobii]|uniref:DNA-binding protein n=1 Tax=Bradyrhizobium centrolobii TaxID=1505087 RepID=A0A176YTJ8_9BRAD|nr:OB-fold domain-containing protein [Bradyrhizobium centrolobii]OAF09986.1 DNA-binding protein [Bradyrhizobium centrolobii]
MSGNERIGDWTRGEEAITYQCCGSCGAVQYFHRAFCAACGAADPRQQRASGKGRVYATSLVCRAATPETRAHVPYNILLVDCAEGFRMMAHGEAGLVIGDEVDASFKSFAGKLVPFFTKKA